MAEAFTWGAGGAKLTPEQLALARALLNRKKSQGVDTSPVGHWTAGAARIADAFGDVLQERRLNNQQAENDQYNVSQTEPLIAALTGASAAPVVAAAPVSNGSAPIASQPQTSATAVAAPVFANDGTELGAILSNNELRATLPAGMRNNNPGNIKFVGQKVHGIVGPSVNTDQGDPQAVFDSPESGMRAMHALLNRKYTGGKLTPNQMIAGNMGWTPGNYGAAANVAKTMGISPDEDIGFNNPERAAKFMQALILQEHGQKGRLYPTSLITSAITGTPSATPAAQAIEQAAPSSGYVYPMVSVQPNAMAPELPAPVEVATRSVASAPMSAPQQTAPSPNMLAQALRVMADPRANENTKAVAQALIQRQQAQEQAAQEQSVWMQRQQYAQQQQQNDPMRQLQMQEVQLKIAAMQDPNANVPDAVKSLDLRAQRAGLQPGSPEYNNFFITQGVKPPANVGAPPAGYQIVYDAQGNPSSMAPIPGSPAALEADAQKKVLANQQSGKSTSSDVITNAARLARETLQAPGLPATGMIGGALSNLPETNAAELRRQVGVLTSNATVENLNAMRAASPTGGALGSVTEKEGAMLAAKSGALDPNSPNFARDLEDYERTLLRVVHGQTKGDEIFNQTRKPVSDDIRAAQDAIAKGAPREMVIKRLQDAGIDTEGL